MTTPTTEVTATPEVETAVTPTQGAERWNMATALSRADIIPKDYRGKAANCFVALDMADRLGCGVMEIMQNTFVVHGTPGFSAKYIIGMANRKGPFKGPIHFDYTAGANPSVTASAAIRETDERVEMTVDMAMAKAEGWSKNPKYKSMPQVMLSYRAGTLLVRLYCPEVLLGMQTAEELEDIHTAHHVESEVVQDVNATIDIPKDEPADLAALDRAAAPEPEPEPEEIEDSHSSLYGDE